MRLVALPLMLAACGDNLELRIAVDHPDGVDVARTTVTVYESATLTCVDLAASRIGADELDAVKVAEQTLSASGETDRELTGISRVDHKVIVARGYAADDSWITAGCEEHGEVTEKTKVMITTIPTVIAATLLDPDMNDPLLAVLATTDATGKAVANRRVGWTVYGPAGSMPMSTNNVEKTDDGIWEPAKASCTDASGAALLHPSPPTIVGGYAVQLRAEWAIDLPPLYSRFLASFASKLIQPPNSSKKYCALRIKGTTRRVVCLDNNVARDYDVMVSGGVATLAQRDMTPIGAEALAVVSVPSGTDRDVYLISTRGVLFPMLGAPTPDNSAAPCMDGSCEVDDVIAVPPCDAVAGKLIVRLRGGQLKQMNARGGGTQDFPTVALMTGAQIQLDNAGCVTRADPNGGAPTLRQVITYHIGMRNLLDEFVAVRTRAAYGCNAVTCMGNELFPGAGVAFTTGSEPRMIMTSVDATGVVLAEVVMAPDTMNRDLFVERSRVPAAAVPDRLVIGHYDADGESDMFWNISAQRGTTFEVAYARKVGDLPLEALSTLQPIVVTSMASADLTGDGHDDVMLIGNLATSQFGVVVIPMNVTAPTMTVPQDPTCTQ